VCPFINRLLHYLYTVIRCYHFPTINRRTRKTSFYRLRSTLLFIYGFIFLNELKYRFGQCSKSSRQFSHAISDHFRYAKVQAFFYTEIVHQRNKTHVRLITTRSLYSASVFAINTECIVNRDRFVALRYRAKQILVS